jgi:hypothetical protein
VLEYPVVTAETILISFLLDRALYGSASESAETSSVESNLASLDDRLAAAEQRTAIAAILLNECMSSST